MQNPTKKRNPESSKASTSNKNTPSPNFLEQKKNLEKESHPEKENVKKKKSRSKILFSNKEEEDGESLLFRRHSKKKKINQKSNSDLNSKYSNLNVFESKIVEEKEDKLVLNERSENSASGSNSLYSNIFLMPTQENSSNSNYTQINSQYSLDELKLASWGLPKGILKKYEARGIKSMFPWQVECLSNEKLIRKNRNLVYSAPTSAGKTLVAEILVLKTVLERQKKVIFILPFVSVVREKMFYLQDLLSDSGVRVEGFMGSIAPAGGFESVHIAIATIEKANSLINRLLEEDDLISVGAVVIDELHLLGDPNRGYILELLLTKLRYISLRYEEINIQLIGMSATLPNLSMLADWLDAELYKTDFRPVPLNEQCKIESTIYNRDFELIRTLSLIPELANDTDNIIQLCIETIEGGHSVLIFCPTKNWCEKLALQTASAFFSIGRSDSALGGILKTTLDASAIYETLEQLKRTPTGLDSVLKNTVSFGVAFHHAGLTIDERDIIEGSFRTGSLKVLVATSTLSTGVNLPARRVIIRSPNFHGKPLDTLSYHQMIGRAGRMGKDTAGESILICKSKERAIAENLLTASLEPIESCLEDSGPLMRSLLEAIASEIVRTPEDLDSYIKCTFIHLQEKGDGSISQTIKEAVQFLVANEFLMLQETEEEHLKRWSATSLGKACLAASVPPKEGLFLFEELLKARKCLALDTELHVVYLVTPYNPGSQIGQMDWMIFLEMWSTMGEPERRVAKLVGVEERFLTSAVRGALPTGKNLNIHRRFYTALALYELVKEIPLYKVCKKFGCNRGLLQSLQQSSSTYAGMITSFCKQLNWSCMELLVAQFQTRLQFGVNRDLMDLLKLPSLNGLRARSLYKEGITSVVELAVADELDVEKALHRALPFESEKEHNGECQFELARQNKVRTTFITGRDGLTTRQAAVLLIQEARSFLQNELGVREVQWEPKNEQTINSSKLSLRNPSIISQHSVIIKEESIQRIESGNVLDVVNAVEHEEVVKATQDLVTKTQNYSNLTNKNKSKKDKNTTRSKHGLMIEITKPSQKLQDKTNIEPEVSRSTSTKQLSLLDLPKDENSESNLESLKLYLPSNQTSVYENIDKETERALEEVLLNTEELNDEELDGELNENNKKFTNSPNLFDSECSTNDCSALEQNVLGSLRLSDFEISNLPRKKSSGRTQANMANDQVQEVFKKAEIIESRKTGMIEDMFSSTDFDVNFTVNKEPEEVKVIEMDANIENNLDETYFEASAFKLVQNEPNPKEINLNSKNAEGLSGIRLSDFEFTAPLNPRKNVSEIRASVFDFSSLMNVHQLKEISERNEAKETSKRNETKEENKNYLSGINISDFEMTKKSDKTFAIKESQKTCEIDSDKTKELLSGINVSEFELSKMSTILQKSKDTSRGNYKNISKGNPTKENTQMETSDFLLANISENLPPIKLNVNRNYLAITKTKVSEDGKQKTENISAWNEDSWNKMQTKEKAGTSDGRKRFKSSDNNSRSKENLVRKRKLIEKRRYSVAEGSPIASVETYRTRKLYIASNQSDSDDMFTPPKKMKVSDQTVINLNLQKLQDKDINKVSGSSKTNSSKPGSSKIQLNKPKRVSNEKLVRSSSDLESSFESLEFPNEEISVHNAKKAKDLPLEISSDLKSKTESDFEKWKPANVIISKKIFTLLKQKLTKRDDIAFALDCETFTENKITIGANILGGNNVEDKKSKSEKFVCGDKKVRGFAISWGYNALYYIPLSNFPEMKLTLKERLHFLTEVLTNSTINVRCFLSKKTYKLLYKCCGIVPTCKFLDPAVADWILNSDEREKNMKFLVEKYYPDAHDYYENRSVIEDNSQYTENDATREALLTWYITKILMENIKEKSLTLLKTFKELEMEVISVLARMELRGMGINLVALQELSDVIKKEMSLLEEKAFFLARKKFNFMSSTSVAQVLGLQKKKKFSTNKAVLEQSTHPISKLVMSWRKLSGLQTKMVFPLLNAALNSRIYGSHITHTVTGRVSMHEPNLQNVPKDFNSEDNTYVISIRMAFIPTIGNLMLSADYCQLELRILAHFSNDSLLRSIMRKEENDIFKSISAKWNNITEEMVCDKMRQRTKQLCYGMIYGMGTKSLAESLSVTESEAKEFLETFMRTYKGIRSWLSNVVKQARVDGYVTTITKRYRMLPGLWSEDRFEKSQAERQAINTKIQGSAADIAKKSMILIDERLQQEFPTTSPIFPPLQSKRRLRSSGSSSEFRGAYLVLQLHDELLFEVNANDLHLVAGLVKKSMEKAYSLEVPLTVKLRVGPTWGDLKEYTNYSQ